MSLTVIGTGSALPSRVFTNEDLSQFVEIDDEWIRTRTGIHQRNVLTGDETLTELSVQAARRALENAGTDASELDYVICSTLGGDFITPSLACMVQAGTGARCPAFDINAACSGFVYGLDVAAGLLSSGKAKKILLVCADALSRIIHWNDRKTCVLFGDGTAAVVLEPGDDLLGIRLTSEGDSETLNAPFPRGNFPLRTPGEPAYLHMNGQKVYKFAVTAITEGISRMLEETGLTCADVDHVLLHQANIRIIEAAQKKLNIPAEKYLTNISDYGNTSSVSIPLMMDLNNRENRFSPGDILVLCGFGGGLTTGTAVLRWKMKNEK